MMNIPQQLAGQRIIRVRPDKSPMESGWNKTATYSIDEARAWLDRDNRYGVLCGANNLIVVDFDSEAVQRAIIESGALPNTFAVKSGGRGLLHLYYRVDDPKSWKVLDAAKNTLVDVQGVGKQVIGPGSAIGNGYVPVNDLPIATITTRQLHAALDPFGADALKNVHPRAQKGRLADDVKRAVKVSDVLAARGIDTSRSPTECPLHASKKRKCLSFDDEKGLFHCFHCGAGGSVIDLRMALDGTDFKTALRALATEAGIQVDPVPVPVPDTSDPQNSNLTTGEITRLYEVSENFTTEFCWRDDGLYQQRTYQSGTRTTPMLAWDSFTIDAVIEHPDPYDETYDVTINGHPYRGLSMDTLFKRVYTYGHCCTAPAKIPFSWMFNEVVRQRRPPRYIEAAYCGFTRDGWILPGDQKHRVRFDGAVQEKMRPFFEQLMAMAPDETAARRFMSLAVANIHIDHKFQFLANAVITPFMHALVEITQFMPIVAAWSFLPHSGKTSMMHFCMYHVWGVPSDKFLKPDTVNSESRFGDYYTLSTFGMLIDDAQDLNQRIQGTMKTMCTGVADHQRKRVDQSLAIDRPLVSPVRMTYNRRPMMFAEPADLDRLFEIAVHTQMTPDDFQLWNQLLQAVRPGVIGRYIIERTKGWTLADLAARYARIEDMSDNNNPRSNTIYKLQIMGAELLVELFGLAIDMDAFKTELVELIESSKTAHFDDAVQILYTQLVDKDVPPQRNDEGKIIEEGHRRASWIKNPVFTGDYKGEGGWMYTAANYQDLKNETRQTWLPANLEDFSEILSQYWPSIHFGVHVVEGITGKYKQKSIFIPFDVEIPGNPDDENGNPKITQPPVSD
ncbi:MAG: bifunctional DNA primase/polymerase [Candidatus Sigynarchaeota archaeon]